MRVKRIKILLLFLFFASNLPAQSFWARYQARAVATQVDQPHWASPLVTTSPRVEQELRADFVRQTATNGITTWNYGNTRGLQFIPLPRTELRISPPPFFSHSNPTTPDGFGDLAFRLKYRVYGSNEDHHNAIISVTLAGSIPTGKNGNGSCCAIVTPTLLLGKGFGKFALTTTASGTLPASNTIGLGRSIVWNNAAQYHVQKFIWLQSEFNSTFYKGGKNDGKQQTFAAPGLIISRIPLIHARPGATSPLLFSFGVGEQIALTHFKTYDHSPMLSGRLRF
jgi:hypothetical protein